MGNPTNFQWVSRRYSSIRLCLSAHPRKGKCPLHFPVWLYVFLFLLRVNISGVSDPLEHSDNPRGNCVSVVRMLQCFALWPAIMTTMNSTSLEKIANEDEGRIGNTCIKSEIILQYSSDYVVPILWVHKMFSISRYLDYAANKKW